jgi:hypothetical protein
MSDSTIPVVNSVEKTTADVAGDDKRNADSAVSGVVPKSKSLVAYPCPFGFDTHNNLHPM